MKNKNAVAVAAPEDRVIVVDELANDDGVYGRYALTRIRVSPDNRKRFDQQKLQELAASIKDMGVAQPILLRPVVPTATEPADFEIVAGERRFRASNIAGMSEIPAMVRILTDLQAAKIRILENLQREDPHPMEEAEGYQQLMLKHGYSADQLAEEIKKSRSYVFGRLKLCSLTNEVREQFLDDKVSASIALLIARIPVPVLQLRAMAEILEGDEPMSYREAAKYLQEEYMLDLKTAEFDLSDAQLLAKAGACSKCPKRAGNQPEVFTDISADVCTDPDCFKEKRAAHIHQVIVIANKRGVPTFENGDALDEHAETHDLVYATDQLWDMDRVVGDQWKPISTKLDKSNAPPVKAYLNAGSKLVPLYEKAAVQAALEKIGVCQSTESVVQEASKAAETAPNESRLAKMKAEDESRRKKETIAQRETSFRVSLYKEFRARAATGLSLQSLREFVKLVLIDDNAYSLPNDLLDVYGLTNYSDQAVAAHIDQATLPEVQIILMDLVLGECLGVQTRQVNDDGTIDDDDYGAGLQRIAALHAMASHEGIDPVLARERFDIAAMAIEDLDAHQVLPFLRAHPERINEVAKFFLADRPHLLFAIEVAAKDLGFTHIGNCVFTTTTIQVEAVALVVAPGDAVAVEGEDLAAAFEAAPAKVKPKARKTTPKPSTDAPASEAAAAPHAATPAPAQVVKQILSPAAAWPFPKNSAAAMTPKQTVSTEAIPSTQEAK